MPFEKLEGDLLRKIEKNNSEKKKIVLASISALLLVLLISIFFQDYSSSLFLLPGFISGWFIAVEKKFRRLKIDLENLRYRHCKRS